MADLIYHYTSYDAFLNIIETKNLWATNIYYTKDFNELVHGKSLLNFLIDSSKKPDFPDELYKEFEKLISLNLPPVFDFYFLSFSKQKNDLSQWRAYANPGVSIGINPELFDKKIKPIECIYDLEEKRQYLLKVIHYYNEFVDSPGKFDIHYVFSIIKDKTSGMIDQLNSVLSVKLPIVKKDFPVHCEKYGEDYVNNLSLLLDIHFFEFYIAAKQTYFEIEKEVRYIFDSNSLENFRIAGELIVPYINAKLNLESIFEIWINCKYENFDLMKYSILRLWKKSTEGEIPFPKIIHARITER